MCVVRMMSDAEVHDKAALDRLLRDKLKAEQEEKDMLARAVSPERTASFIRCVLLSVGVWGVLRC